MVNNNITQNEQKLIKENEILSKIILEIVYRDEKNMTDEQIDSLFKREDWKERTEFKLTEHNDGWWMGYKGVHSYLVRPRKPLAIFKRLIKRKEEVLEDKKALERINFDYRKKTEEQGKEISELKKELKEKELLIEKQKEQIAATKLDAETHYDFIGALERLNGKVRDELHEEIENNLELLEETKSDLEEQKARAKELEKEKEVDAEALQEISEQFEEQKKIVNDLQKQINLDKKPLPKIPSKFKLFKQKTQAKFKQFQHVAKKAKVRTQEFIARIEVKVK